MSKTKLFFTICICFIFKTINAQVTQTIRGRVTDATTQKSLVEASVVLDNDVMKTSTDTEGGFRLEKVPVGRHILKVGFVGFETLIVPDILLESGKEIVLDISLKSLIINTDTLVVTAQRERYAEVINGIRNERLSRYPATFNDPARLITYLAGAATTNDQGNNISVRGSSPNTIQWYLDGAEIVNPNHLSNAGTLSDQATVNGGGVLIPSFNSMDNTLFYKGAMSADMGGALTSVMDIRMRKGNDEHRETQVSLGLIGLEVGTEGMFSKKSKASYLVHYRYSTLGLLSKLGVPLGDEDIQFQDLSINLNFPTKKAGNFNIFGIAGTSENVFKHLPSRADWKVDKDSQDINFTNRMGAIGLRHEISIGQKGHLSTVLAYSALENARMAVGYGLNNIVVRSERIENNPSKLFLKSVYKHHINTNHMLKMAMVARLDDFESLETEKESSFSFTNPLSKSSWWLQPSASWEGRFGSSLTMEAGLRVVQWNYLPNNKLNETHLEPMASVQYRLKRNSSIKLGYSLQSQMTPFQYERGSGRFIDPFYTPVENVSQAHNIDFTYIFPITKNISVTIQTYYQSIFNASLASLNFYERVYGGGPSAVGRNMGLEIDVEQKLMKGFYWRANASLFDAKYKTTTVWKDNYFNAQYIANALVGKEWTLGSRQNRFLGVNGHVVLRGGYIDAYTNKKLSDYFRTDLNVYWKVSHNRYASTVQLDLQNVTNQQNEGWRYYDYRQGRILTRYQLGLIPNLAYKVEF